MHAGRFGYNMYVWIPVPSGKRVAVTRGICWGHGLSVVAAAGKNRLQPLPRMWILQRRGGGRLDALGNITGLAVWSRRLKARTVRHGGARPVRIKGAAAWRPRAERLR